MSLYNFDTSAIVDLWVNYPIQNPHFKPVWSWFDTQVEQEVFVISNTAFQETKDQILFGKIKIEIPKSSFFIEILNKIKTCKIEIDDLSTVQEIKMLLNIQEDNYHSRGVGENDLLIIANAKRNNHILVTSESRQPKHHEIKNKAKYKIPTVCNLNEVNVESINLTELLHLDSLW